LRDRQRLLACPADTSALMIWGERLLAFPGAGGLGRADLHDLLELELINRAESLAQAGSWGPAVAPLNRQPRLAGRPVLSPGRCIMSRMTCRTAPGGHGGC